MFITLLYIVLLCLFYGRNEIKTSIESEFQNDFSYAAINITEGPKNTLSNKHVLTFSAMWFIEAENDVQIYLEPDESSTILAWIFSEPKIVFKGWYVKYARISLGDVC